MSKTIKILLVIGLLAILLGVALANLFTIDSTQTKVDTNLLIPLDDRIDSKSIKNSLPEKTDGYQKISLHEYIEYNTSQSFEKIESARLDSISLSDAITLSVSEYKNNIGNNYSLLLQQEILKFGVEKSYMLSERDCILIGLDNETITQVSIGSPYTYDCVEEELTKGERLAKFGEAEITQYDYRSNLFYFAYPNSGFTLVKQPTGRVVSIYLYPEAGILEYIAREVEGNTVLFKEGPTNRGCSLDTCNNVVEEV